MSYYVYILQNTSSGRFYIGHCGHLIERFREHQRGYNPSTKGRGPWWMPYFEFLPTRSAAMKREKELKAKKSSKSIRGIIRHNLPGIKCS